MGGLTLFAKQFFAEYKAGMSFRYHSLGNRSTYRATWIENCPYCTACPASNPFGQGEARFWRPGLQSRNYAGYGWFNYGIWVPNNVQSSQPISSSWIKMANLSDLSSFLHEQFVHDGLANCLPSRVQSIPLSTLRYIRRIRGSLKEIWDGMKSSTPP